MATGSTRINSALLISSQYVRIQQSVRRQGIVVSGSNLRQQETAPAFVVSYDNRTSLAKILALFEQKTINLKRLMEANPLVAQEAPGPYLTAQVSDTSKAVAKASSSAAIEAYSLGIEQMATVQTVTSAPLDSMATTKLTEGTHAFILAVGETEYELSIEVNKNGAKPDTNKDVFRKLQSAIAEKSTAVKAYVTETSKRELSPYTNEFYKEYSSLTVRRTGMENTLSFSIRDLSGDIIDELGLNRVTTQGTGSRYRLNGGEQTSLSNTVSLDKDHLSVSFLDTTDQQVSISVKGGEKPLEKNVTDLIAAYNTYIDWLDQQRRYLSPEAKKTVLQGMDSEAQGNALLRTDNGIRSSLETMASTVKVTTDTHLSNALKEIGLEFDAKGRLNITDAFSSSFGSNIARIKEVLAGEKGFLTQVSAGLEQIIDKGAARYGLAKSSLAVSSEPDAAQRKIDLSAVVQALDFHV